MDSKKFVTKSMVALTLFTTTASTLPLTVSANSHKETTHKKVKHHKIKHANKRVVLPAKNEAKHHKVKKAVTHKKTKVKAKKHSSFLKSLSREAAKVRHAEIKGAKKSYKLVTHKERKGLSAVGKAASKVRHNEYKVFKALFHHHKK